MRILRPCIILFMSAIVGGCGGSDFSGLEPATLPEGGDGGGAAGYSADAKADSPGDAKSESTGGQGGQGGKDSGVGGAAGKDSGLGGSGGSDSGVGGSGGQEAGTGGTGGSAGEDAAAGTGGTAGDAAAGSGGSAGEDAAAGSGGSAGDDAGDASEEDAGPEGGCIPTGPEQCDGVDNDCNGSIDDMAPVSCYSGPTGTAGVGTCKAGTQTCSGGMLGPCQGEVIPATEQCDGADNNCDGTADNGIAPASCYTGPSGTAGVGLCKAGTQSCVSGGWGPCTGEVLPATEQCDGADNDCNGSADDGIAPVSCYTGPSGTVGVGVCKAGTQSCVNGGLGPCAGEVVPTNELCDGQDNNCNGSSDEGNPESGALCGGAAVGSCTAVTECQAGSLVCVGTFVGPAPLGAATNPGTKAAPVLTINQALTNAKLIGGGVDVCVCDDTTAAGASTFTEDITMTEGISVLGGYACNNWSRNVTANITIIQDTTANGVKFPAGITTGTALDGFTVLGQATDSGTSVAITVTNSSPSLIDLTVQGGTAPTSYGLMVSQTGSGVAAPVVNGGSYQGKSTAGGTQIGAYVDLGSPKFSSVTLGGSSSGGVSVAATSVGLRCLGCSGTTITGGQTVGGTATNTVAGLWATGTVTTLVATDTGFLGGVATATTNAVARAVHLEGCSGSPSFTNSSMMGGGGPYGQRIGFQATGVNCSATVTGGTIRGCENGATCAGAQVFGAPCVFAGITALQGSTNGATTATFGLRCHSGGCTSVSRSAIAAGFLNGATIGMGVELRNSSPVLDSNNVQGPLCNSASNTGTYYGTYLFGGAPTLINNILRDGGCNVPQDSVHLERSASPGVAGPIVVNNTIEYSTWNGGQLRRGLSITAPSPSTPGAEGAFHNNIIRNAGSGGQTFCVVEDANSSPVTFLNNDLFDSTAVALYRLKGATDLTTIGQVNAQVNGAANNISGDPLLNSSWHIPVGSPCRNAGTTQSAPNHDFEAQTRPQEALFDIGADEYQP